MTAALVSVARVVASSGARRSAERISGAAAAASQRGAGQGSIAMPLPRCHAPGSDAQSVYMARCSLAFMPCPGGARLPPQQGGGEWGRHTWRLDCMSVHDPLPHPSRAVALLSHATSPSPSHARAVADLKVVRVREAARPRECRLRRRQPPAVDHHAVVLHARGAAYEGARASLPFKAPCLLACEYRSGPVRHWLP